MNYAIGIHEGFAMGGPIKAVSKNCPSFIELIQGDEKPSNTAKTLKKKLSFDDIDELIRVMPVGCKIKKVR
jgi:hypothetical protein